MEKKNLHKKSREDVPLNELTDLLELDDIGVGELLEALDLPEVHGLLPRVVLPLHTLDGNLPNKAILTRLLLFKLYFAKHLRNCANFFWLFAKLLKKLLFISGRIS